MLFYGFEGTKMPVDWTNVGCPLFIAALANTHRITYTYVNKSNLMSVGHDLHWIFIDQTNIVGLPHTESAGLFYFISFVVVFFCERARKRWVPYSLSLWLPLQLWTLCLLEWQNGDRSALFTFWSFSHTQVWHFSGNCVVVRRTNIRTFTQFNQWGIIESTVIKW